MSTGVPAVDAPPLRVGLTGGIASGKTLIAGQFAALGAAVIDADQVARELTAPGAPLLGEILERFGALVEQRFGSKLLRVDGSLDRALLRRLVFEDAEQRRSLEGLLHPRIRARMAALSEQLGGIYQVHIVPLLVETGSARRYDRVLLVDCPEALQLQRLQARDGIDPKEAQAMLAAQASRAARLAAANDVIVNDAEPEALGPKVAALDRKYRELARAGRS